MPKSDGSPIVLAADRSLTAAYPVLLDAMLVASQTSTVPVALLERLLLPRARGADGARPDRTDALPGARLAPLGLRRIEAALRHSGFGPDEVTVAEEAQLARAIGKATRVVGISCAEAAGLGMSSTTMTAVAGGRILPQVMFERLLRKVRRAIKARAPQARVVLGGAGAWQAAGSPSLRKTLGLAHVVTGYAEGNAGGIFRDLLNGRALPEVLPGASVAGGAIPRILGASTLGAVELSRGCGLGCHFCTLAHIPMAHLPEETILADIEINLAAGQNNVTLVSEDFFRYGGAGTRARPEALLALLRRLRRSPALRLLQIAHANLLSISQFSDDELAAVHRLLAGDCPPGSVWVNVGVESASGELLVKNGGGPKMGQAPAREWGEFCRAQTQRLIRAGFLPLVSLVMGLPGETLDDVRLTRDWVDGFADAPLAIFPVLYAPPDGSSAARGPTMRGEHWELMRICYKFNFRHFPQLVRRNHALAGVPAARRWLAQVLGCGLKARWAALLRFRAWQAKG